MPQVTTWHMRVACWLPDVTNTHSDFVMLVFFHCNNGYANASQCYVKHTLRAIVSCVLTLRPAGRQSPAHRAVDDLERNGVAIGGGKVWGEKEAAIDFLSCHVFRCDSPSLNPGLNPMHYCHPTPNSPNIFIWSLEINCC
jgi:hypothetical protein